MSHQANTSHRPTGAQPGFCSVGCRCWCRQILLTKQNVTPKKHVATWYLLSRTDMASFLSCSLFQLERDVTFFHPWYLAVVGPPALTLILFSSWFRRNGNTGSRLDVVYIKWFAGWGVNAKLSVMKKASKACRGESWNMLCVWSETSRNAQSLQGRTIKNISARKEHPNDYYENSRLPANPSITVKTFFLLSLVCLDLYF